MSVVRIIGEVWFILSALMLAALIGRYINRKRHGEFDECEQDEAEPLRIVVNPKPNYRSLFDPRADES